MPSASASHRRVEPSISVNKNVTTPEGGPSADTRTGCHTEPTSTQQTATDFRDSRKSSISRPRPEELADGLDVLTLILTAAPARAATAADLVVDWVSCNAGES